MEAFYDFSGSSAGTALKVLLQDKTTNKNIIWATKDYAKLGSQYSDTHPILLEAIDGIKPILLQPRAHKAAEIQKERTKYKAEVFTPSWICNKMNNYCDEVWFGRKNVFNVEGEKSWTTNPQPIKFPKGKNWKEYVDSKRIEITCGEAPFMVSRYDSATGELIPVKDRIGHLDRKLRIVSEKCSDEKKWIKWTIRAFQSVYGYEYQGDNLLIGRLNLLMTFVDYMEEKWHRIPTYAETMKIAEIIAWNFWQMDGLTDCVPLGAPKECFHQGRLFGDEIPEEQASLCVIRDWRAKEVDLFRNCKKEI